MRMKKTGSYRLLKASSLILSGMGCNLAIQGANYCDVCGRKIENGSAAGVCPHANDFAMQESWEGKMNRIKTLAEAQNVFYNLVERTHDYMVTSDYDKNRPHFTKGPGFSHIRTLSLKQDLSSEWVCQLCHEIHAIPQDDIQRLTPILEAFLQRLPKINCYLKQVNFSGFLEVYKNPVDDNNFLFSDATSGSIQNQKDSNRRDIGTLPSEYFFICENCQVRYSSPVMRCNNCGWSMEVLEKEIDIKKELPKKVMIGPKAIDVSPFKYCEIDLENPKKLSDIVDDICTFISEKLPHSSLYLINTPEEAQYFFAALNVFLITYYSVRIDSDWKIQYLSEESFDKMRMVNNITGRINPRMEKLNPELWGICYRLGEILFYPLALTPSENELTVEDAIYSIIWTFQNHLKALDLKFVWNKESTLFDFQPTPKPQLPETSTPETPTKSAPEHENIHALEFQLSQLMEQGYEVKSVNGTIKIIKPDSKTSSQERKRSRRNSRP